MPDVCLQQPHDQVKVTNYITIEYVLLYNVAGGM
jgi:hypothetical protein